MRQQMAFHPNRDGFFLTFGESETLAQATGMGEREMGVPVFVSRTRRLSLSLYPFFPGAVNKCCSSGIQTKRERERIKQTFRVSSYPRYGEREGGGAARRVRGLISVRASPGKYKVPLFPSSSSFPDGEVEKVFRGGGGGAVG